MERPDGVRGKPTHNSDRQVPMVSTHKDKPPIMPVSYDEACQRTAERAQMQHQQQMQQQMQYQPYDPRAFAGTEYYRPNFWEDNKYAIFVFMICFVSMFWVLPKFTAMMPAGAQVTWVTTAIIALIDAFAFQMTVKYV